jgi:hypothetical protein
MYTLTVSPPTTEHKSSERSLWRWRLTSDSPRPELGPINVVARGTGRTEAEARSAGLAAHGAYKDHDAEVRRTQAIDYITKLGAHGEARLLVALGADGWVPAPVDLTRLSGPLRLLRGSDAINIFGGQVVYNGAHINLNF